jgi:hypothetical protein
MCHVSCISLSEVVCCTTSFSPKTRVLYWWCSFQGHNMFMLIGRSLRRMRPILGLPIWRSFSKPIWSTLLITLRSRMRWRLRCTRSTLSEFICWCWSTILFLLTRANGIHVTYLRYFEDLMLVADYAWGAAALIHLYNSLSTTAILGAKVVTSYMTLHQVTNIL